MLLLEVRDDADELAVAVEDEVERLLGEVLGRDVERELRAVRERLELLHHAGAASGDAGPRLDGALGEGQLVVRDDEFRFGGQLHAEARAAGAGAVRAVEREDARLDLGERDAAVGAGEATGHQHVLVLLRQVDRQEAVAVFERLGDERQHLLLVVTGVLLLDAGHDRLDRVALVAVEPLLLELLHRVEGAVDAELAEARPEDGFELLLVLALLLLHDRREDDERLVLGEAVDAVDDLARRLLGHRLAAVRAVRLADAREQQAEEVVDLGDGPDGRSRIRRHGLLVDGDGRTQARDLVDVRLILEFQELAGVRRQALHVAALSLGVDGVEGQARFSGTGKTGHDHELVLGNVDGDVLQVVRAGAADADDVRRSRFSASFGGFFGCHARNVMSEGSLARVKTAGKV
jgi:hypothetical protein